MSLPETYLRGCSNMTILITILSVYAILTYTLFLVLLVVIDRSITNKKPIKVIDGYWNLKQKSLHTSFISLVLVWILKAIQQHYMGGN